MTKAAVIGSGPNGLAAAIELARNGIEVTVLEAVERPGGGMRTSELTSAGVLHDNGSAFHPMGKLSPFFASLDLAKHGLSWSYPETDLAHPLDDGRTAVLLPDRAATATSLGVDAKPWRELFDPLVDRAADLVEDVLTPATELPRHPLLFARFAAGAALPATTVVRRFRDEPAKALFMGCAAHSFARLDRPLSASVAMLLAACGQSVGWPVATGGSAAIAAALVLELESLGGQVRCLTPVTDLAQVPELCGGPVDVILLDTSVKSALELCRDELSGVVRRGLKRFRFGPAAFKLDLELSAPVPWSDPQLAAAGTVHLGGSAREIVAAENQINLGQMPKRPFVLVGQQFVADPSRSRPGRYPLWTYAHVPAGFTGDASAAIISQLERFAPGVSSQITAAVRRGPAELAAFNPNYVGGDIGSGANSFRQLVFRPRITTNPYRLSQRLYLCSAATAPGAGVHGMCGLGAAKAVLRDLRETPGGRIRP